MEQGKKQQGKKHLLSVLLGSAVLLQTGCSISEAKASNYAQHPEGQAFIKELVSEGFAEADVRAVLAEATRQESILEAISRPAEKRLTWGEYRNIFIQPKRITRGVTFWQENAEALARAEKEYGVPAEYIVAIIGVETHYGRIMGKYRVVDALTTLGFDYPKRAKFFRGQLKEYFHMVKEEQIDPLSLKGSYAGAMGFGQFIPSSFRNFAVDFDGDGQRNIWTNKTDAIGSVANYFARHGWKQGGTVISDVKVDKNAEDSWFNDGLKPKLTLADWSARGVQARMPLASDQPATLMRLEKDGEFQNVLGLHNFYVITRYNHSRLYAMAVHELSQAVKAEYGKNKS